MVFYVFTRILDSQHIEKQTILNATIDEIKEQIILHHEKAPNQLKMVTKIPISKLTEAKEGEGKTCAFYATLIAVGN